MFGNILQVASLGTSTNTKFLEELKSRSELLCDISESFVERGKDLHIFSFYETDKMDYMNCLVRVFDSLFREPVLTSQNVVEKQSAILDWPNETTIRLNGNHSTICKFSFLDDQRYRTVWSNLREISATSIVDRSESLFSRHATLVS